MPVSEEEYNQMVQALRDASLTNSAALNRVADFVNRAKDDAYPSPDPTDPVIPPTNDWPVNGTWEEKALWVKNKAGCKVATSDLRPVNSATTIPASVQGQWSDKWAGGALVLTGHSDLSGLDIDGLVVVTNGANGSTISDSRFKFLWSNGGNLNAVKRSTVHLNDQFNSGQGGLNALGPNAVVEDCDISGSFDGIQWSGGGTIRRTYIHDLTTTATSHNDWVQNYNGLVGIYQSYFMSRNAPTNKYNGIFSSNNAQATFYCEDSMFTHVNPQGSAWWAHANTGKIRCVRCRGAGRDIKAPNKDGHINDVQWDSQSLVTTWLTEALA